MKKLITYILSTAILLIMGAAIENAVYGLETSTLPKPIGEWHLDGNVNDSAGSLNGTLHGGVVFAQGNRGQAVQLDGVDGYVTIPNHDSLSGMDELTVSAWVNLTQRPVQNFVAVGKDMTDYSYRIVIASDGRGHFVVNTTNAGWYTSGTKADFTTPLTPGSWYHIVGTYDGEYVRVYVNGKLQGTGPQSISGSIIKSSSPLHLGYKVADNIDYTKGLIDEVGIYDKALSSDQVQELYKKSVDPDAYKYKVKMVLKTNEKGPFGFPRPQINAEYVPLKTSYFFRLHVLDDKTDSIIRQSIDVSLKAEGEEPFHIMKGGKALTGHKESISQASDASLGNVLSVYIDSSVELKPATEYKVTVKAQSKNGFEISEADGSWTFTTESRKENHKLDFSLDLSEKPNVNWKGQFYSGIVKPDFATTEIYGTERFDFIYSNEIKKKYPKAWNLYRDFHLSGFEHQLDALPKYNPNIVRELETRRIVSIEETKEGMLLTVEDFFGHEQYGIPSNRPLSADYKQGDEILISDSTKSVRAFVISTDDKAKTVLVTKYAEPAGGDFLLNYLSPLPQEEDPGAPGLFPDGGTYLRKFNPAGTPMYYWGRLDHEWDLIHKGYGQRMVVGFCDAPGDVSYDGAGWTTAKDYVELHKVTYDITCHLIDRYGDATLTWVWSVFNEPDLGGLFWRSGNWTELQKFYDYSVDAILKAFEDKGYDSDLVFIGGLELGGVSGTNLRLEEFLAHCSPTAVWPGALLENAAYKDPRLEGKRSQRVEKLCRENNGRGTPLDFISIHTYNHSQMAAAKIIKAKEVALRIDPDYYKDLWINNFESVPTWMEFTDPGAAEWTLGNGYFPTWAADITGRLLQQAAVDPRYSHGESIYTVWGFSSSNFGSLNDVVTGLYVGTEHRNTRKEIIPKPIFNFTNLLSTMGNDYWVLPQYRVEGDTVSGFASPCDDDIRLLLYSHDIEDTQSRSDNSYDIAINLKGVQWDEVMVAEYQFDKRNNTYYPYAVNNKKKALFSEDEFEKVKDMAQLKVTGVSIHKVGDDGILNINVPLASNGINFIVISEPRELDDPIKQPDETAPEPTPGELPTGSETDPDDETPIEPGDNSPTGTKGEAPGGSDEETPASTAPDTSDNDGKEPDDPPKTGDNGVMLMVVLLITILLSSLAMYMIKKRLKSSS